MATDVEKLIVQLSADIKQYERQLARAQGVTIQRTRAIESQFARMNRSIAAGFSALSSSAARAFVAVGGVAGFRTLSDSATRVQNALKAAGLSGDELKSVYDQLFQSALRNAAPLESLVTLYGRVATVQKELGVSSAEMLSFTDNVALALRVAGTDAQTASGALLQLSQALGGGVVRAEEFNSMLDGALPIVQAAAAGIEEAGGSVAKLRTLVNEGKVSSEAFFRGFEAGSVTLRQRVADSVLTIDQRMTNLNTALVDAAGRFNESSKAAETFGQAIDDVAQFVNSINFDSLIQKLQDVGNWLNSVNQAAQNFGATMGEATGADQFTKWLTGGAPTKDFLGGTITVTSTAAIRDRINQAFEGEVKKTGELTAEAIRQSVLNRGQVSTTEKTGRLPAAPQVKPVSLSDFKVPATSPGSSSSSSSSGSRSPDALASEIEQIKERTAELNAATAAQAKINPLIQDYGYALAKAKAEQELTTAAQKAGREITPQLAADIQNLAARYAEATAASERLEESQDKLREKMQQSSELGKDVFGGFIRDMRDGTSAAEALSSALSKIGDKVLDIGLTALFDGAKAGSGGGLLGGLFSFLFAEGGYTGSGSKNQPAGIVHAGEYVFSKKAVDRIGAGNLEAMHRRLKGYSDGGLVAPTMPSLTSSRAASGGMHITVGVSADANGNLLPFVESVTQRGIAKAAPQIVSVANRQVVPTMAKFQTQKARRSYRD